RGCTSRDCRCLRQRSRMTPEPYVVLRGRLDFGLRARSGSDRRDRLSKLLLDGGPVQVRVLARNQATLDGDHVHAVAGDGLPVAGRAHLILAHEVSVTNVHPLSLEANVRPLGKCSGKGLARRIATTRRLAAPVEVEHGVISMQGDDGIKVVLSPRCSVANGQLLNLSAHFDSPFSRRPSIQTTPHSEQKELAASVLANDARAR